MKLVQEKQHNNYRSIHRTQCIYCINKYLPNLGIERHSNSESSIIMKIKQCG